MLMADKLKVDPIDNISDVPDRNNKKNIEGVIIH